MNIYLSIVILVITTISCKNVKQEETRQRYGIQNFGDNDGDASPGVDGIDGDGLDAGGDAGGSNTGDDAGGSDSTGGGAGVTPGGLSSDDISLTANGVGSVYSANENEKVNIIWSAPKFQECKIEPISKTGLTGSDDIVMDRAYLIIAAVCSTAAGESKSKTLVLLRQGDSVAPPASEERINLFVPSNIEAGKPFEISWNAFGYDACEVSPLNRSGLNGSGSLTVTETTQITVECTKDGVKTIETKLIEVTPAPKPEITVFVNGQSGDPVIQKGQDVYVSWDASNLGADGKCEFSPSTATRVSNNRVRISSIQSAVDVIITCENASGTTSITKKISVQNPVVPVQPISANLTVNGTAVSNETTRQLTVKKGSNLTIQWQSENTASCELRSGALNVNSTSGSETLDNITTAMDVILVCRDSAGTSVNRVVSVKLDNSAPLAINSFRANGQESVKIVRGHPVSLQWTSTGASNCLVTPGDYTGVSNNIKIDDLQESTSYQLKCFQGDEQKIAVVAVNVLEPYDLNPGADLSVNGLFSAQTVNPGDDVNIAWTASLEGTQCTFLPTLQTGASANFKISNIQKPFVAALYCYNKSGFDIRSININVKGYENPAKITNTDITVNNQKSRVQITKGDSATYRWQSQNATKCVFFKDKIEQLSGSLVRNSVSESEVGLIYCSGESGSVLDAAYIDSEDYAGGASAELTVNKLDGKVSINHGEKVTLRWTSKNAHSCHIRNVGNVSTSGEKEVVLDNTTVFRLRCISSENNNKLQDVAVVNVKARELPPLDATVVLYQLKNNVKTHSEINAPHNSALNLGWEAKNSSSCQLAVRIGNQSNYTNINSSTAVSGALVTTRNIQDIVYRMTCVGTNGSSAISYLKVLRDCPAHVAFTTLTWFAGNQVNPGGSNILQGADNLCLAAARQYGLCSSRSFKALLSSGNINAKNKITINGPVFNNRSTGRQQIAANTGSFWTNGRWQATAKYSESGALAPLNFAGAAQENNVWTGTNNLGASTSLHCSNWTRTTGTGTAGSILEIDDRFRDGSFQAQSCSRSKHLYCISQ